MNAPMKRNISGSAYGANTSRAGATRMITASDVPSSAVTGIGRASVIQRTTTVARIAASRCASGSRPGIGRRSSAMKMAGARKTPARLRTRSKRISPGLRTSIGTTVSESIRRVVVSVGRAPAGAERARQGYWQGQVRHNAAVGTDAQKPAPHGAGFGRDPDSAMSRLLRQHPAADEDRALRGITIEIHGILLALLERGGKHRNGASDAAVAEQDGLIRIRIAQALTVGTTGALAQF